MKDSYEQRIQNQFGAFCVKVLKNEARHIQRDYASLLDQEKSLDELTASELGAATAELGLETYSMVRVGMLLVSGRRSSVCRAWVRR